MGFSEETTKRGKSDLLKRKFKVHIKNTFSKPGIPQNLQNSSRTHFSTTSFSVIYKCVPQAVDCKPFLYADDTCLVFQQKDITDIEMALNKNFTRFCD